MSFAFYAAPVDNENFGEMDQPIHKKKFSKTLKKYPSVNSYTEDNIQTKIDYNKVNQVMKAMSNLPTQQDELGDFNPPPPPQSSGVQSTIYRDNTPLGGEEGLTNYTKPQRQELFSQIPTPNPSYNIQAFTNPTPTITDNDILMEKINYMIHLLEEQQDEKSGSVTEEVILYSFLGIFIIFIVDSFYYVGKYTR
jgi:hypothetical protein